MSARRVFRYRLDIVDRPTVELPIDAEVLSVGPPRDGTARLDLWALVHVDEPQTVTAHFRVVGTGNPMPDDCGRFIGTVATHGGALVWHVFEVTQ